MSLRKRLKALPLAALVAVAALTGAPSTGQAETVVRAVLGSDLQSLDPIFSTNYAARTVGYMLYDTLFAQDGKGDYKPQMLEFYEISADALTYRFKLRDGLLWSDGKPVTAADCVASIQRWQKNDGLGEMLGEATASLTAVDDKTFVLTLAKPFGLVIDALGKQSSNVPFMMPERLAKTDAGTQITEIVGSGPFLFKADEWVPGSKAVFVKNPNYKPRSEPADGLAGGKVVNVDRVEILTMPDGATQVSALKAGEIDFIQYVPYDMMPLLTSDEAVKLGQAVGPAANMGVVRLNHANPPLDNPKIRLAFQQAIDRAEVLAGLGAPADMTDADCRSVYTCGSPYASQDGSEAIAQPNTAKAKEMLAATGYKGELLRILAVSDSEIERTAGTVIVAQLKRAGFNVEVEPIEVNTLFTRRKNKEPVDKGGWSAFITFLSGYDLGSPVTAYYIANSCNPNYAGWSCDEETKQLLGKFAAEPDLAKRKEIAARINLRTHATVPYVLWGQFIQPFAYRTSLSGVLPTGDPVFWNLKKAAE